MILRNSAIMNISKERKESNKNGKKECKTIYY